LIRKISILLVVLSVIFVFGLLGVFVWWKDASGSVGSDPNPKRFVVVKGTSASQIAENLYKAGLIKSTLAFKFYVQLIGKSDQIKAGQYDIPQNYSLTQVVATLMQNPKEVWVTIPEGLRREEVVRKIIEGLHFPPEEAESFGEEFLALTKDKEGFLFPDTYLFPIDVKAATVVNVMENTFKKKVGEVDRKSVILASIIERETKTDEERPVVAGILIKRLEAGWPLNVDATVQYALANENCKLEIENCIDWWPKITRDDYQFNSLYNTYKFAGLPPGPISNPGLSSIKAVLAPKQSDYWYYLHAPDGKIYYAKNLKEHNQNIQKYLK